jgi:hypothetical protein
VFHLWSCSNKGWNLEGKGSGGGNGHVKTIPPLPHFSRSNLFFQANHSLSTCMHIQLILKTPMNMCIQPRDFLKGFCEVAKLAVVKKLI